MPIPSQSVTPRSRISSLQRHFSSALGTQRYLESTVSGPAATEQFKTTIEARQRRLILGGARDWCDDFVRLDDRRK